MENEDISPEQLTSRWCIDLDWYQSSNRSFSTLAERSLCDTCRERLQVGEKEVPTDELLAAINRCCSQEPGFITGELPILESIFRLFLANGNQPMDLEGLSENLSEWRSGATYSISVEILSRLLESDRYYGLRQVSI